jgi:hypothetical protein
MTDIIPPEVMCFDIERGLAKALGSKCETFECGPEHYKIRIGQRWNLILTREQLDDLHNYADNPHALKDQFDLLRGECLVFQSYARH